MLESLRDIEIVGDVRGPATSTRSSSSKDRDTKEHFSHEEAEMLLRGYSRRDVPSAA
jgi:hypothetical protein